MTHLTHLFDRALFDEMVDGGYVRLQQHPTLPLTIANYAEKAQFEHVWNDVTLTCRGLIYDPAGTVVARPYRKFFNYGDDQNTGPLDLAAQVVVSDKLDGSLGISYDTPNGTAIATRGSFTSDQALHATKLLRERYPEFEPLPGYTYLWEIVYPENRIVVDYDGMDDLILHGLVHIETGRVEAPGVLAGWVGPVAEFFPYPTLADALAAPARPNREGLVVRDLDTGLMVKIKQADYVALHRIITGLNARTVWEWLGDGKTVGDLCATLPDEFHGWVEDLAAELHRARVVILNCVSTRHNEILEAVEPLADWTRGDYARYATKDRELAPYLFLYLDGNYDRASDLAWQAVKPSGARTLVNHSEAVA